MHCDGTEIAARFGIHPETLYRRVEEEFSVGFTHWLQQKRAIGKSTLREKQWKVAADGNQVMLIWLGKQYLDQADKKDIQQNIGFGPKFTWESGSEEDDKNG